MGEYAEMAREREMDFEFQPRSTKELAVWTCRDGRAIKLTDMADSHLQSTITMLQGKSAAKFGDWISAMERELLARTAR